MTETYLLLELLFRNSVFLIWNCT